jgi:putative spermidine/putrescine transport system ATP-binding protein
MLPPWKRRCSLVFQNYALFPHMTVVQNVAFGLEMQKVPKAEYAKRIAEALAMVRLNGMDERYPRQLSGGQQQRVAIARSLAVQPDILLLDEPLSNLDAKLRQDVRVEIRELQRRLGLTTVMVTHDQEEALTMADRMVVMNGGEVHQAGTQKELYETPANRFVAGFIGKASFIEGEFSGQSTFRSQGGLTVQCAKPMPRGKGAVALRAEHVVVGEGASAMENSYMGRVEYVSYLGSIYEMRLRLNDSDTLMVHMPNRDGVSEPSMGEQIPVGWSREAGMAYAG